MKKFIKRFLAALMIILVIAAAGVYAVFSGVIDKINKVDNEEIVTVAPEAEDFEETDPTQKDAVTVAPESIVLHSAEPIVADHLINILLVGQDKKEGQTTRQRSDTMILCSYNPEKNEVSLISFLRDLYVAIPGGYSNNRLNAAYAFGGFPLLYNTLKHNFGVTVNGGVEVDFSGFVELIDLIGGVDIYLTAKEAPYVASACTEGINHLNGTRALNYARIRKIDSDFGRTQRQKNLILAVFEKLKDSDVKTLTSLLNTGLSMVTTDMTKSSITSLAAAFLPKISTLKINSYTVPFTSSYKSTYVRGMAVLVPDCIMIRDKLESEYLPI